MVLAKKNEQVKDNLYSISLGVMETLKDIFYCICLSYVIGNRKKDVQATYASSFPKAFPCNLILINSYLSEKEILLVLPYSVLRPSIKTVPEVSPQKHTACSCALCEPQNIHSPSPNLTVLRNSNISKNGTHQIWRSAIIYHIEMGHGYLDIK